MGNQKQVLDLTVRIGEVLLKNGGEIFRVQQTMYLVAKAYGVTNIHIYVLANGLFTSVDAGEDGAQYVKKIETSPTSGDCSSASQIRHIPLSSVHLGRVTAVNNLSRAIVAQKYTIEQAWEKIEEIDKSPSVSEKIQILSAGIGAGSFCYLLGGEVWDGAASFLSGILLWSFVLYLSKRNYNKIMVNILSSALVTMTGIIMYHLGFGHNMDKIIIGSIIPLVPGVPLTNSIRDFLNGDYLSGTIRMIDAVMVACCIALGVGMMLRFIPAVTGISV